MPSVKGACPSGHLDKSEVMTAQSALFRVPMFLHMIPLYILHGSYSLSSLYLYYMYDGVPNASRAFLH